MKKGRPMADPFIDFWALGTRNRCEKQRIAFPDVQVNS